MKTTGTNKWTFTNSLVTISWRYRNVMPLNIRIQRCFWELTPDEKLKLKPAGRPKSWRAGLLLPSFPCHLSLHLLLLSILLLLFPPLLKESSSALQLTVLFLVLCAICCLKTQLQLLVHQRNNTQRASKCIFMCVYMCRSGCVCLSQVTWVMGEGVYKYGWSAQDAD